MKPRSNWKKGAVLLQTLVMSVILSMISVMVLKWVLARYIIVNRIQESTRNTGNAQGYAMQNTNMSSWATDTYRPDANDTSKSRYNNPVHFERQGTSAKYVTKVDDEY